MSGAEGAGLDGLVVREVEVRYGPVVALDGVTLSVPEGRTLAVVGPSGCGKTTLLRAVAGLEPVAAGSISAFGRPLDGVPVHRRGVGLMFQDHALFPHLDVAGNVAFGLRMAGWAQDRQRARVDELLDLVGLAGYGDRAVHELSGGQAQRVALARALAPEPALLLLDEPFGSLDRVLRDELADEVRRLLDRLGQTAVFVTHDQAEAFTLADRIAVLLAGRLVQIGTPAELWGAPATAFVARFVGQPNVWSVTVDDERRVRWAGVVVGERDDLAPGDHEVMVPLDAVEAVGSAGGIPSFEVVVTACRFHDGGYRVEATPEFAERADEVSFESATRRDVGERVRVAVAIERATLLGDVEI